MSEADNKQVHLAFQEHEIEAQFRPLPRVLVRCPLVNLSELSQRTLCDQVLL